MVMGEFEMLLLLTALRPSNVNEKFIAEYLM
jgi:hypothetical protein